MLMRCRQKLSIRWMNSADLKRVAEIEARSFVNGWKIDEFREIIRRQDVSANTAILRGRLVGYLIYSLSSTKAGVMNWAVDEKYRRQGIGTELFHSMRWRCLRSQSRRKIVIDVWDRNLGAQLFLRSLDFKAAAIMDDFYIGGDAAYRFVYDLGGKDVGSDAMH